MSHVPFLCILSTLAIASALRVSLRQSSDAHFSNSSFSNGSDKQISDLPSNRYKAQSIELQILSKISVLAKSSITRPTKCSRYKVLSNDPNASYTVVFVLAGRRDRMSLLMNYLDELMLSGSVDEVHLWDITRTKDDKEYLNELKQLNKYTVFENEALEASPHEHSMDRFDKYKLPYHYYAPGSLFTPLCAKNKLPNATMIMKADDDVVYIDVDHFEAYKSYILGHRDKFLVFPNIVNNAAAVYYQAKHIPEVASRVPHALDYPENGFNTFRTLRHANRLHKLFAKNPDVFSWEDPAVDNCITFRAPGLVAPSQGQFSINFFGVLQPRFWDIVKVLPHAMSDEEGMTATATSLGLQECIFTPMTVAHLAFGYQHRDNVSERALPVYYNLWETRKRGGNRSTPV